MPVITNDNCEFCGHKRKWLVSSTFHGFYCEECVRLVRIEELSCLKEIKRAKALERGGE